MAHRVIYSVLSQLLLTLLPTMGKVNHVPFPENAQCLASEFLDTSGLTCYKCNDAMTLSKKPDTMHPDPYGNALGCACAGSFLEESVDCSVSELQSGVCEGSVCLSTCHDSNLSVSLDSESCVACGGSVQPNLQKMSIYNETSGKCSCNNPVKDQATQSPVVTFRLVETYDNFTQLPIQSDCLVCPLGTAVITHQLMETQSLTYSTAGVTYLADGYTCASCPDPNMYFDTDYNCVCESKFTLVGEASIGAQSCIQRMPSIATDFTNVDFQMLRLESNPPQTDKTTVDSIVFSHYYLSAASTCEFLRGVTPDTVAACQTLANLCVMRMHDDESSPCIEFKSVISQKRLSNYWGQGNWMHTLPWLYYNDEAAAVTYDRGIKMKMAFAPLPDHTHKLEFKIAKYAINGEYLGMSDLADDFFSFCPGSSNEGPRPKTSIRYDKSWRRFGNSHRYDYDCDLNNLLDTDMFFYDLYVVDAADDTCHEGKESWNCLFPVPVLNRNLVEGGTQPNMNAQKVDELNDKYTRRFFLFDNMSGKSATGLKVLRYAQKIILEITIQSENPSRIYPPQLIIEYVEQDPTVWADEKTNSITSLLFKAEYTMRTDKFWTTIKITLGFVCAVGVVSWILRIHNWQNRNRRASTDGREGSYSSTSLVFHATIMLCHIFAILFTPFIFLVCAYWFVFFKLQKAVFVLMPRDSEFYGTGNEYFFFFAFIHGLFWSQSVYIAYIIYRQCQTDVFLIDWEKPKGRYSDVSMWRTVTVINEWNKMQTRRKTSIELSLVCLGYLMISLKCYNFATAQPDLTNSHDGNINIALRFANNTFFWFVVSMIQWAWRFVLEYLYKEPDAQLFVDLSTIAKISVFIMDEPFHGFYLHCRSPHEFADVSMEAFNKMMKKEENGFTTDRSLDAPGVPMNCQTFELFTSDIFRKQIDKAYKVLANNTSRTVSKRDRTTIQQIKSQDSVVLAKSDLNDFLQNFVEQYPTPQRDGLMRVVRDPPFAERVFGIAPADVQGRESKCILYPDQPTWINDYEFLKVTFLGIEFDLLLHDILAYNLADLTFGSPMTSILLTYLLHLIRTAVRDRFGKTNLARKTFFDKKFIL